MWSKISKQGHLKSFIGGVIFLINKGIWSIMTKGLSWPIPGGNYNGVGQCYFLVVFTFYPNLREKKERGVTIIWSSGSAAGRQGRRWKVSKTPRWPPLCIWTWTLIYLLLFPRHRVRASLLLLSGPCVYCTKTLHHQLRTVLSSVFGRHPCAGGYYW